MVASLWAFVKAVPMLYDMFNQMVAMHMRERVAAIVLERITIDQEIDILYLKVSEAQTNEERLTLANAIDRINNGSSELQ